MMHANEKKLQHNFLITILISTTLPVAACLAAQDSQTVNVAPFGEYKSWETEARDYGVIWEYPRDIFNVVVKFSDTKPAPEPNTIRLEYWQSSWPEKRIPRDRPSGAGESGWLNLGDWFQGKWLKADANLSVDGTAYTFTFNPLNSNEFPKVSNFPVLYRTTLKLRIIADEPLANIESFEAYTDSVWDRLEFEVEWGGTAQKQQTWDGRLVIFNGIIKQVQPLSSASKVKINADYTWASSVLGVTDGIKACILYTKPKAYNSFDETLVTIRSAEESFSFAVSDLIKYGYIFLPDFGVIVRNSGNNTTYCQAKDIWEKNRDKNIYMRVASAPEQTLIGALKDIPSMKPGIIPLGFEGGRQFFALEPDGNVYCRSNWPRIPYPKNERSMWGHYKIQYLFGLSEEKLINRYIIDGCLPLVVGIWQQDGVRYKQTAFVVPLDGVPQDGRRIYTDYTHVLMMRFEIESVNRADNQAKLKLEVKTKKQKPLSINDGMVFDIDTEPKRLCMYVTSRDAANSYSLTSEDKTIAYHTKLTCDNSKRTLDIAIPFIPLTQDADTTKLKTLEFGKMFDSVRTYWLKRIQEGTQIFTPDSMINDFYKADISHLLINTVREVGASDRYIARVGTWCYGAFGNESCMMVSDLDRRGYHKRAEEVLKTWLHYQGTVGLPGDFSTKQGQFYGAGGYEQGGYNQHHGFILWCMGEHYWYTRDTDWLMQAAPKIIKGCEWIIHERQRTIAESKRSPMRAIESGLLPAGYLEDIKDWRSWLSTNVYSWWGMQNAAAALDCAGIPEGKRLLEEAEVYRKDILRSFTEAMHRSPVVRLRDGSWIPHVPPEVHRRGRCFGWITETLEGAIHMIRTGIIEPWDRLSTWIIKDYEDNLYISEQYGYNITGEQFERYWFSRGSISMQANLLCNPIPYLLRDEPKHFLRAYFNAFAVSYWPDTRMMTEHVLSFGQSRDKGDCGYKTSDESNSTYWLRMMFIQERGDELWLGAAVPRYWLANGKSCGIENARTYFGHMSAKYNSNADRGCIEMILEPPRRNPPKKIFVRFRHPDEQQIKNCQVNGRSYDNFDVEKEWVLLDQCPSKQTQIVVYYE